MAHDWPGNIREVENAIEHAFILCHEGYIDIRHLPEELRARGSAAGWGSDIGSAHDILEGQAIRTALERNAFNRIAAARTLGIHKTTLFRQMEKLGITPPKQDGRNRCNK
jgi:transcriptional regulator of acetoin/glycerol metabolism